MKHEETNQPSEIKVEKSNLAPSNITPDTLVTAIIKVRENDYRPTNLTVRVNIGRCIFTAEFLYKDLTLIENDPLVEAVSISKPIDMVN